MKKVIHDEILKKLIKNIKYLRIEITKLKKFQKPSASNFSKESMRYIKRCMWCDTLGHKHDEYDSYKIATKEGIFLAQKKKDKTFKL